MPNLAIRHYARRLAYWNGLLWAIGNGLCSITLVIYLATELHAKQIGLGIGLILAARYFIGILQLGTPAILERWGNRKRFCLITFGLSGLLLLSLPFLAAPNAMMTAKASLACLVLLWCLHHLMQYLGTIAFLSWMADLVPQRIRGRFFGLRNRWLCVGEAVSAIACGVFAESWQATHPKPQHWIGYAIPAGLGAIFMLGATLPIGLMPREEKRKKNNSHFPLGEGTGGGFSWEKLVKPFDDRAFSALLLFGCWFSFSNGLTQTLQFSYPHKVLHIGLFLMLAVQTGMRLGQIGVSPYLGKAADSIGNKPMMLFCLQVTAQGPLFYLFSTPSSWWWFIGAWVAWIAYAGLNIGLPNLMLKIAPRDENADYLAIYYTFTGLCYGGVTLLGGWLFDQYGRHSWCVYGISCDFNQAMFLLGWIARLVGIFFLLRVRESR